MLHRLAVTALGLALLVPTQAASSSAAPAPRDAAASSATAKNRDVALGHRSVGASSRARVRLTFDGRDGQLVNLARWGEARTCGARVLRTRSGRVVQPWARGYWRLPRTATYTALAKPCRRLPEQKVRVQVRRVVEHPAAVPGVAGVVGRRTRVTHLVPVPVGQAQSVEATTSAPVTEVVGPDRKVTHPPATGPLVLTTPGEHWVALPPETAFETVLTVRHAAQVDGPRIPVPALGTAATTHEVGFTGQAGQWVYAELLDPATGAVASDTTRAIRVVRPDGRELQDAILHDCGQMNANDGCTVRGPWRLPATGDYTMTIAADGPAAERPTTLRIRAAAVADDLAVNGPSVTYAATSPGQWVVGRYPVTPPVLVPAPGGGQTSPGTLTYLEASNVSPALGAWGITVATSFPFYALNCSDKACEYVSDHLDPGRLRIMTPPSWWVGTQSFALLVVPPDAQGSMDLTLTKPAQES
ncbi:hypothetical protein HN031_06615 [Nocardioides sp. zg-1308]|uniref:hypothetical protein n=1 Tax=Nocardioides sp. zg-1308 TaxID=2736253 RepID=UPI001556C7B7|nr:hypothetical protein [Nocardioides sp. zg-1308]NPD04359.1 hypothetical protein [Nocardioides sp. zg-1308]